jgi:CheY-like chemotaxis protein
MNRVWMIAEDDPVMRRILKMLMTLWEIDALMFEDGNQAWKWLDRVEQGRYRDGLPEVALVDIRMPGHMGHEVGRRMRSIGATSGIPLIIMTAYQLSKDDRAVIQEAAHPEHIIPKPFPSLDEFRSLIERTIEDSAPRQRTLPSIKRAIVWQAHLTNPSG